jgi:Zn-dependent metalloprotease
MAGSTNAKVRKFALDNIAASAAARAMRSTMALLPGMTAIPSPSKKKHRLVYDGKKKLALPGKLVREESKAKVKDAAANEAYDHTGSVYDFWHQNFDRNSLDGNGMSLISTVHHRVGYGNAFWNGEQMAYGDGDGVAFNRFTLALDVIGHELAHGIVTFTSNLDYQDEPGALNEHFADVFGVLCRQWRDATPVSKANWLIGAELVTPAPTRKGIRDMSAPGTAFVADPHLGTDPQPQHLNKKYTGSADFGGVHINSGIPNYAFYLIASSLGGRAWETPGKIWYRSLLKLTKNSDFKEMARTTWQVAVTDFDATTANEVKKGWAAVGIAV